MSPDDLSIGIGQTGGSEYRYLQIYADSGEADFVTASDTGGIMTFAPKSHEVMRLNGATGNVGIGTTNPTARLQIENPAIATGSELVTNGSFTGNASGWTLGDCAAYSSNSATVTYTACGDPNLSTPVNLVSGHNYKLTFTVTTTGDQVYPWFNNNGANFDDGPYSTGTHTIYISSDYTGTDDLYFESWDYNNDSSWTIDDVTFKEVSVTPTLVVKDYKNEQVINIGNGFGNNVGIGANTLQVATTGINNNAFGSNALLSNTTGNYNIAMGNSSLYNNTIGSRNIAIGEKTLYANVDGTDNTAIGYQTMEANTSGSYNTALGIQALNHNTIGQSNVALGQFAMSTNTEGNNNVAIGTQSMYNNLTGNNNVAVGIGSLQGNTLGYSNVALGNGAMVFSTTGNNNIALGENALAGANVSFTQTGFHNIAIGPRSLYANSSGQSNTAIGYETMFSNLTGFYNTVIGESAFSGNESGAQNTIIGHEAGRGVATSSNIDQSSIVGFQAGYALLTGGFGNTLFGYKAGDNITTGSKNIVIGYDVEAPTATSTQTLNIGNLVFATGLNGTGTTLSTGSVGIGTSSPSTKLEIGSSDLGNGAAGPIITLGRNNNGTNTGAGSINFQSKGGTAGYVWQDNAGNVRINTSAPSNANDTAGVVIGTQTSTRNTKQDITDYTDYAAALNMVTSAPLHTFRYIKDVQGYGINSLLAKPRIGYIADEVSADFMWGNSIDQVSVNGILMASVKALNTKITDLQTAQTTSSQGGQITANPNLFSSNTPIVLQSQLYLNEDNVGQAKILAGQTSVRVNFTKPYEYLPIVTTTPNSRVGSEYWIDDKDSTGFTIYIDTESSNDVVFDWHSFAGQSAKLFVSSGEQENINIVVVNQPQNNDGQVAGDSTDSGDAPIVPDSPTTDIVDSSQTPESVDSPVQESNSTTEDSSTTINSDSQQ